MKTIKKNHNFRAEPRDRRRTKSIVYHHSFSDDVSSETIHGWHLSRGWLGIGYAVIIRFNGNIEEGRGINKVGAHAGSTANPISIGVCMTGDFTKHKPTREQIESAVWFNRYCFELYGELLLEAHRDHMNTTCPGHLFPMNTIIEKTAKEEKIVSNNLTWEQEQSIKMIKELEEMGELKNPAHHIDKIKKGEPLGDYVYLTLVTRLRRRMG